MTEHLDTPQPAAAAELRFDQTVPRMLAHRRAVGEVFVTDTAQVGADEFLAAIQVPRAHSLWFDRTVPYHDPLSAVEAVRQVLIVIGQRHLRLPADTPASLQRLDVTVEDLSALRDKETEPLEGIVRVRSEQAGTDGMYLRDATFEASLTVDRSLAMTVRCGVVAFPRETYDELRALGMSARAVDDGTAPDEVEPVDPSEVGRMERRNVVIRRSSGGLALVVDQRHPSFFDHPYDHVPGPLLLEGIRQAALLSATGAGLLPSPAAAVTAAELTFVGFAELGGVIDCVVSNVEDNGIDDINVELELHQFGHRIAHGRIELAPYP